MPGLELRLAIVAGIAAGAMVLYLIALMAAARIYGRVRRLRRANFVDAWEDYLASEKAPVTARILSLHPAEVHHLLRGWNLAFESAEATEGQKKRYLEIAYASELTHAALAFAFRGRNRDERLSGIEALGHIGRREVLDRLIGLLSHEDPLLSLAAFQAVVRIDPTSIRERLGDLICRNSGWPEHAVAESIRELDETSREVLVSQVALGNTECVNRVIATLERIYHAGATELIRFRLDRASSNAAKADLLYAVREAWHTDLIETSMGATGGPV